MDLDPWQQLVLERALADGPDGRWLASQVACIVPRQNGKGVLLEALELAHLVLFGTELILHSAHLFVTSSEAFRRLKHLVQGNPDIERRVLKMHEAHGQEGIEFRGGQRIKFVARSRGGGRGMGGGLVVLDEAFRLFDAAMEAMYPTMAAQPNPQVWFTSSAPVREEDSDYLRRLMRRGRRGDDRLCYLEWSAESPAEDATDADREAHRRDPRVWAQANPGLGWRIFPDYIDGERAALSAEGFDRERLGIFPDEEVAGDHMIDPVEWLDCRDVRSRMRDGQRIALDVSKDRRFAAVALAGESARGGVHVELAAYSGVNGVPAGVSWVPAKVRQLQERLGGPVAVALRSPAAALKGELERAGVDVLWVPVEDHAVACGNLLDAVTDRTVRHVDQAPLNVAVDGAQSRDYGDAWLWSRKSSHVDICPLVAVTLAHWMVLRPAETGAGREPFFAMT